MIGTIHKLGQIQSDIPSPDDPNAYIVGALVLITTMLTAGLIYLVKTFKQAQGANDSATAINHAVNNVGPNEQSLRDLVIRISEDVDLMAKTHREVAAKGWHALPEDLNNAVGLTGVIRDLQRHSHESNVRFDVVEKSLDDIKTTLHAHVEWEVREKYKDNYDKEHKHDI